MRALKTLLLRLEFPARKNKTAHTVARGPFLER